MPIKAKGKVVISGGTTPTPSPEGTVPAYAEEFRFDFDRNLFAAEIAAKGYDVLWEKGIVCPYRKGPSPRDHDINCEACSTGYLYVDPKETQMLVTGLSLEQNYYAYGRWDTSRVMITALPEMKVSLYDRIKLCNSRQRFSELLIRNPNTLRDRPKYNPLCVDFLLWVDKQNQQHSYREGIDFIVATNGDLVWNDLPTRPDQYTYYAVSYYYRPQYIVIDTPNVIRDSSVKTASGDKNYEFPVKVIGQLDFVIRDERKDPVDEDARTNPFPSQ